MRIKAVFGAIALTLLQAPVPTSAAVENGHLTIPAGTEIPLVMGETISSKRNVKGGLFLLYTVEDLTIDGMVAIPKGTKVLAELTRAEKKGAFGRSGKLEARLLYAELENRTIRLTGSIGNRGQGGTTETVLTAIAVGTLAFIVTGKSAEIKAGTEMSGYLTSQTLIRNMPVP
jgi:hypothetical protein